MRPRKVLWLTIATFVTLEVLWTTLWLSLAIVFQVTCDESTGGCEGMPLLGYAGAWFGGQILLAPLGLLVLAKILGFSVDPPPE